MTIKLKTYGGDVQEIIMNEEAQSILSDLTHPAEIEDTKKNLFNVMHLIAEMALNAISTQYTTPPEERVYINNDCTKSLYVLGNLYSMLRNIKPI